MPAAQKLTEIHVGDMKYKMLFSLIVRTYFKRVQG